MITVPAFNFVLEYRNDVMITVSAKVWRIQVESCTMFMNEAPSSFEQDGPTSPSFGGVSLTFGSLTNRPREIKNAADQMRASSAKVRRADSTQADLFPTTLPEAGTPVCRFCLG